MVSTGNVTASGTLSYNETMQYHVGPNVESVGFAITTKEGIIKSLVVTPKPSDKASEGFQKHFAERAVIDIVGKPLAGLKVHAVGGASLTTEAFQAFAAHALSGQK